MHKIKIKCKKVQCNKVYKKVQKHVNNPFAGHRPSFFMLLLQDIFHLFKVSHCWAFHPVKVYLYCEK